MKIIDISYSLSNTMTKYPSLLPYKKKWLKHYSMGDDMALSYIETPSHNGTHLDAPHHYCKEGKMMHEMPLESFMGEVLVIEVPEDYRSVSLDLVKAPERLPDRVLFKTSNSAKRYENAGFREDYVAIDPDTAAYLVDQGVKLVGIDYVSVDPKVSPDKLTHHAFLDNNMILLETIRLDRVSPGFYTLIALPVKTDDVEAALCRAVLIEE